MKHRINLQSLPSYESHSAELIRVARHVLRGVGAPPGALTLVLTGEDQIQDLNLRFAKEDNPTDVLSFPDGTTDPDSNRIYYGDVILCVPIAEGQAKARGHQLEDELALLTIHGILHLFDFDHSTREAEAEMWAKQDQMLTELDYHPAHPSNSR